MKSLQPSATNRTEGLVDLRWELNPCPDQYGRQGSVQGASLLAKRWRRRPPGIALSAVCVGRKAPVGV